MINQKKLEQKLIDISKIKLSNKSINPHYQRGLDLLEIDLEEAINEFYTALDDEPNNAMILSNLGSAQHNNDDYESAETNLKRSLELDPTLTTSKFTLGMNSYCLEKYEQTITLLKEVIDEAGEEIVCDDDFIYYHLGSSYSKLDKHHDALIQFHKIANKWPSAKIYSKIGSSFLDLDKYDEAIRSYQKAIKLKPNHAFYHLNLANAYMLNKDSDDLVRDELNKAIEIGDDEIVVDLAYKFLDAID